MFHTKLCLLLFDALQTRVTLSMKLSLFLDLTIVSWAGYSFNRQLYFQLTIHMQNDQSHLQKQQQEHHLCYVCHIHNPVQTNWLCKCTFTLARHSTKNGTAHIPKYLHVKLICNGRNCTRVGEMNSRNKQQILTNCFRQVVSNPPICPSCITPAVHKYKSRSINRQSQTNNDKYYFSHVYFASTTIVFAIICRLVH